MSFAPVFDVLALPAASRVEMPRDKDAAEVAGLRRLATAVLVSAARELNDPRADRAADARAFVFDVERTPDLKFWTDLAALDWCGSVEQYREASWMVVRTMRRLSIGRAARAASPTAAGIAATARPPVVASRRRHG